MEVDDSAVPDPISAEREKPTVLGLAAALYVLAWLCGLSLFDRAPGSGTTDLRLAEFYRDHRWASSIQALLVHGVAAIALLVVAWAIWQRRLAGKRWLAAAAAAASLSLLQLGLELWRSIAAGDPATVVRVIDRLDGAKMLALGAMVVAGMSSLRRHHVIGRPLQTVGGIAAALAAAAGLLYLSGDDTVLVAGTALSGLLIWIPGISRRVAEYGSLPRGSGPVLGAGP